MSDTILLGHGGGGRLSSDLLRSEVFTRFPHGPGAGLPDAAVLPSGGGRLAFTTDGFVVRPLEFPGGNIGDLAVHGTVNDLATAGARPKWLSLGMILEEGLPIATLRRLLDHVAAAAADCGVTIVTGDTKVVGRGQCEGAYFHTAGIGEVLPGFDLGPHRVEIGDAVIVSGTLGDHGMAVMSAREGLPGGSIVSDTGPIHRLVASLSDVASDIHFMRDPTRGGLAATVSELVGERPFGVTLREVDIPYSPSARALSEVLGIDLLHVASEGRVVCVCRGSAAPAVLERFQSLREGAGARQIGVISADRGTVQLQTAIGGTRAIDMPLGELLPRIC